MRPLKAKIVNWCLKHLCNSLTPDDVLKVLGDRVFIGEKEIAKPQVIEFAHEARAILKFSLYNRLQESIRSYSTDMMVNKSKTIDDLLFAKAFLYIMDIERSTLEAIAKIQTK